MALFLGSLLYLLSFQCISVCQGENSTSEDGEPNCDGRCSLNGEYIGCYGTGCLVLDHNVTFREGRMNSPDACSIACEERGFAFAAIFSGMDCSCSCPHGEQDCLGKRLVDSRCGIPCNADRERFCGGYMTMSLYRVNSSNSFNVVCSKKTNDIDSVGPVDGGPDEQPTATSSGSPKPSQIDLPTAVPISIAVVAFIIITVAVVLLVYRRQKRTAEELVTATDEKMTPIDKEPIDKGRYLGKVEDRRPQAKHGSQYQPLNTMPKLPDIPVTDEPVTTPLHPWLKDRIYEEPDLEESAPTTGSELSHEYLVSGQDVPSKSTPSDEYHEYNYPDVNKAIRRGPGRITSGDDDDDDRTTVRTPDTATSGPKVGEDRYLQVEDSSSKVYYSSRLPNSKLTTELKPSQDPRDKVYYSSSIPISVHQEDIYSQICKSKTDVDQDDTTPPKTESCGQKVYYSTHVPRKDN